MALHLTQIDGTTESAFEALLTKAWRQNWGPELGRALIRWRYHDRPAGSAAWLVWDDGQCVAMLDSFVRPYLLDGRRILVRETCDWYCLPKYRPLGLGIRLMRQMMAGPEPVLSIGGSEGTLAMLPRLGWTRLADVRNYVLPVKARGVASSLLRKRWPRREAYASAIPGFIPFRPPRRAQAPFGRLGRIAEWGPGAPAVPALPQPGLVQLLEDAELDWIARMPPELAQPLGLLFFLDDAPVGCSLSQIEPAKTGVEGRIVHLQVADSAPPVMDWIVGETASHLAALGAAIIRCWASSPEKVGSLHTAGFVAGASHPSYWWPKPGVPTPGAIDAGSLRADDAFPFATLHARHLATAWLPPMAPRVGRPAPTRAQQGT